MTILEEKRLKRSVNTIGKHLKKSISAASKREQTCDDVVNGCCLLYGINPDLIPGFLSKHDPALLHGALSQLAGICQYIENNREEADAISCDIRKLPFTPSVDSAKDTLCDIEKMISTYLDNIG